MELVYPLLSHMIDSSDWLQTRNIAFFESRCKDRMSLVSFPFIYLFIYLLLFPFCNLEISVKISIVI